MTLDKTTVDWFRFRAKAEPKTILDALRPLFNFGHLLTLVPLERGILGFQQGGSINLGDMALGRMDYGGESQNGWVRVDLTGTACQLVEAWNIDEIQALHRAELRRVDIALTTWAGEIGHQAVVDAYAAGEFTTGGRPPDLTQITSSDATAGKTCYIGKRTGSGKFMRCYEKGYEMASKRPGLVSVNQHEIAGIYRCEVEFKAGKDLTLPWAAIAQRDSFFAGAYPFCQNALQGVQPAAMYRDPSREPQMALDAVLAHACKQFGPTFFTALQAYGGDIMQVWEKIVGRKHNTALLAAGVLQVDHEQKTYEVQ